jgi:trehalose synthase
MAKEIETSATSPERFRMLLPRERYAEFEQTTRVARELLDGRVVWNLNSTALGGGVVELLRPLIAYARGVGIDARWFVIEGPPEFFAVTKRIHNRLHGTAGDGGPLDGEARRIYEAVLAENMAEFGDRAQEGDVVILHDPQTAGLVPAMLDAGAFVIWRCHVGLDHPNEIARQTWQFLLPYLRDADACVFSRESFAWKGLDRERITVIAPTIDAFAPKNVDLPPNTVRAALRTAGLVAGGPPDHAVTFERTDGTRGRVQRRAEVIEDAPLPADAPAVVQISRWDALKDPVGVIRGFAEQVPPRFGAHLVYGGPAVAAVADDPEGAQMLRASIAAREQLPPTVRARIHLATLPMEDPEENAIMVNALQRHARVIVQKSLAEGFGLTVAEAMWKGRPVVASRIGGIQEQIVHGVSGILLDDPRDLAAYGSAVAEMLAEPARAEEIGRDARERVRDRFLSVRSLLDYTALIRRLMARAAREGRRPAAAGTAATGRR